MGLEHRNSYIAHSAYFPWNSLILSHNTADTDTDTDHVRVLTNAPDSSRTCFSAIMTPYLASVTCFSQTQQLRGAADRMWRNRQYVLFDGKCWFTILRCRVLPLQLDCDG